MGLFDNVRFLNELMVNNQEQPDDNDDKGSTDYTASDNDNQSSSQSNDNNSTDYTTSDSGDNTSTETDDSTDYTQADTSNGEGEAPTDTPAGNPGDPGATDEQPEESTDYTATDTGDGTGSDPGSVDGGGDGSLGDTEGDPGGDGSNDSSSDTSSTDSSSSTENPDEIKKMEEELFADFSPQQLEIKNKELKGLYSRLYDTTDNLISKINDIPKVDKYLNVVEFISIKISETRNMIIDYMNNTYSTNSYTVNLINYNKFLAILHGVDKMIEEIEDEDKNKDT